jgi:Protein of unknown function (DUF3800)
MERRKVLQESYVNLLRQAKSMLGDDDAYNAGAIEQLISAGQNRLNTINQLCGGRIVSRRRPRNKQSGETCYIYLDECGAHELRSTEPYQVFVLSAAIIHESDLEAVDKAWKDFKIKDLGEDVVIHEPEVRKGDGPFEDADRAQKLEAMRRCFAELPFAIVTVVVHRDAHLRKHGLGPIDVSLPAHLYWMSLDFLMERAVLALDVQFKGASAQVVAEARGPLEDAQLQYEFARLHLDGTSYIRAGWFRQALLPGVTFLPKEANITGLQLADLVARPVGDKVLDRQAKPYLWEELREKMCPDVETEHSILGLKIMPWDTQYEDLWKS